MNEGDDVYVHTGMTKADFFDLIDEERERLGIPIQTLCDEAEVSHPQYYKYKRGVAEPRIASLLMFMAALIRMRQEKEK